MNFDFNEQQKLLRDSARELLTARCTSRQVRAWLEAGPALPPDLWQEMAELGWLGLTLPEAYGGAGGDLIDLAVILEEMGHFLVPGPFIETAVILAGVLGPGGSPEQQERYLNAIAAGRLKAALAFLEARGAWDESGIELQAMAGGRLAGSKLVVPWAGEADLLLVPARVTGRGCSLFLVDPRAPGVSLSPCPATDPAVRLYNVDFAGVQGEPLGPPGEGWSLLEPVLLQAAAAAALDILGGVRRVLAMTAGYLSERVQFNKPVGSFQAPKHIMANMHIAGEGLASLAYYAVLALSDGQPDAAPAVRRAKAWASDGGRQICQSALQLHGGNGFTWEFDVHLFLKRALRLEMAYGNAAHHREVLSRSLR